MRKFIDKSARKALVKSLKQDPNCCFVYLNGKRVKTRQAYYGQLKKQLQLNESFSNNLDAYKDMMCDAFTYFNKAHIVIVIKHYDYFLCEDPQKPVIEAIFDDAILSYFNKTEMEDSNTYTTMSIYCETL